MHVNLKITLDAYWKIDRRGILFGRDGREQLEGMNQTIFYKNLKIGESSFVEKVCYFIEYEYIYISV